MIKMSRKAKKAMAVALTAGMLASTAVTPVMAATQGWKQNSKGWWYQNADGTYPANKWSLINGKWYYFDANGYMLANKWVADKAGKWYYVGADGAMKTNAWAKDKNGLWYWVTDDGSMFEGGWAKINGEYYFFKNDGAMQSGVVKVDGKTYYLGRPDQGWMQTGAIMISATTYNFDKESGACTDAKAPAAEKAFDKTGKEVENNIDIEAVDGITGTITNALSDYKEYGNVLIAGDDAYLKILVSDKDGNPVVNTPVALKMEYKKYEKAATTTQTFANLTPVVQQTDADGYVNFVIGAYGNVPEENKITPTSGDYALISLTATATATNQSFKTDLAFATIDTGKVNVLNDDDKDDDLLVEPSKNATSTTDSTPETFTVDGKKTTEYVSTQKVSDKNSTNHRVELELNPKLIIPVTNTQNVIDNYKQEVNKEIKEYSVYQDGGNTSFKVEKIPAGLKYATLNFSSIDLSAHTKVEIYPYEAGTTDIVTPDKKPYVINGATSEKNFGYQIPVQNNIELDIVVKIISEGQVDDDRNGGLVVTDVTGVYDTKTTNKPVEISLDNSVTWSQEEIKYSNTMTLDRKTALKYLPLGVEDKYTKEGNTYTYKVPVYPYTGNAILTVTNANKQVVGYFTIPTVNYDTTSTYKAGQGKFQNENILVPIAKNQAVLVSKDEAFNNVGTITPNKNKVVINSEVTGITAVKATIDHTSFNGQINLTNNTVYSSVQWSPLPNTQTVSSDDFYALVGQNITVKAQLVDKNGNKVSQEKEKITFKYDSTKIEKTGALTGTSASVISFDPDTDANGQATIKLTSGSELALVKYLEAESSSYDVQLTIGDTKVSKANLRWVETGLSFTSSVFAEEKVTVDTLNDISAESQTTLQKALKKDTGSNWIFGYKVVGETQDDKIEEGTDKTNKVVSVEGLKVTLSKNGEGDIVTTGMDNGTAKVSSKKAGATTLTGTIDKDSLVSGTDVIFNIDIDGKGNVKPYKNVGEGTPTIDASLNLPITWGTVGEQINLISPKGTNFVVADGEQVYVKVTDENFNEKVGAPVTITVTYTLENGKEKKYSYDGSQELTGDPTPIDSVEYGLVPVTLKEKIGSDKVTSATITAKVGNVTLDKNNTITYKKATDTSKVDFALVNANYVETKGSNAKVELTFTTPVNAASLNKDMFAIYGGSAGKVVINSAAIDEKNNNKVILTLRDEKLDGQFEVNIFPKRIEGIDYQLCDNNGRDIYNAAAKFSTSSEATKLDYELKDGKITVYSDNLVGDEFIVVYNGTNVISNVIADEAVPEDEEDGKGVTKTADDSLEITLNGTLADGDITVYSNGGSVVIKKADINSFLTSEAKNELETELASVSVPTVASYDGSVVVSVPTTTNSKVSSIKVTESSTNKIFADNATDKTTLSTATDISSVTASDTATVVVVYEHTTNPNVTSSITYSVTTDGSSSITFQKVQ